MVRTAAVDRFFVPVGEGSEAPDDARALTVAALRKKIAAVSGGVGGTGAVEPVGTPASSRGVETAPVAPFPAIPGGAPGAGKDPGTEQHPPESLTAPAPTPATASPGRVGAQSRAAAIGEIPLPRDLQAIVPSGAVFPGQIIALAGGHSLVAALVATATGAGKRCAIIGYPALGLAAVAAEGGDLSQVALVPSAGADPGVVASVLLDGMDMVVLDPACGRIPPARARVLAGRARSAGTVLVAGVRDWPGADLHLESGPSRCAGLDRGYGRIFSASAPILARGKALGGAGSRGEITLHGCPSRSVAAPTHAPADMTEISRRRGADVPARAMAERRVG